MLVTELASVVSVLVTQLASVVSVLATELASVISDIVSIVCAVIVKRRCGHGMWSYSEPDERKFPLRIVSIGLVH